MVSQILIKCANPAPQTISYGFDTTGGGANWNPAKYYAVHVTASYDPDDQNIYLMGVANFGWDYAVSDQATLMEPLQAGVSPGNADDELTVTWTAPPGPPPHHYNIYIQGPNDADDTYDFTAYGNPMVDAGGVTNDTFTFTISDPTDIQGSLVTSTIINHSESGTNDYVVIEGNHVMQFGLGTSLIVDAAGANISTTVVNSKLTFDARGIKTYITTANDLSVGVSNGELITYRDMRHTFNFTAQDWSYDGAGYLTPDVIVLDPVMQLTPHVSTGLIRDNNGYLMKRARTLESTLGSVDIQVIGTSTSHDDWRFLMEYMRVGSRLWLTDLYTSGTDADNPHLNSYLCRLVDTDYTGSLGKNSRQRYTLRFEIEEMKAMLGAG